MTQPRTRPLASSWVASACVLIGLELVLIYQAVQADTTGLQKIFGVFVGLAILCFASQIYLVKLIFYD